ncbi:TPA: hypothetical protein EYP26_04070 [Candidatus Bathyarchaeota archaeon]|nr:hypothetical protein [Candidatus Bathyarchaeota archaeon]
MNVIAMDPWIQLFAYFGLVYSLFLAGLEIDTSKAIRSVKAVAAVTLGPTLHSRLPAWAERWGKPNVHGRRAVHNLFGASPSSM